MKSQRSLDGKAKFYLTSEISLQRMDAFWNVGLKKRIKYFELALAPGVGIEKTFFQKRFSPHLEIYSFYNIIQQEINRKRGILFGPGVLLSATSFRADIPFRYGDLFIGYQFCIGNKFKILNQGGYGIMFESFHGNNGKVINRSFNYFIKVGLSYAVSF
jgi:hypothetical protein